MNIYVVSHSGQNVADRQLIEQLSRITFERKKATPVIVVDDRYNLDQIGHQQELVDHTHFHLDDFLHDKGSNADGVMVVDINKISKQLNKPITHWVLFEFGQNDQATCLDFVQKLARYSYMTPSLRNKNIVFSVPSMYLVLFARMLNESFNNLPCSPIAVAQSGKVGMLFMSTNIEKVLMPLWSGPMLRLNRLLMFIYQRFVKVV